MCVCVEEEANWPTEFPTYWTSYKYSYSHTTLITVKGKVHIGGELYIIEKVIYLNTNLLDSYWTSGVKKIPWIECFSLKITVWTSPSAKKTENLSIYLAS